MIFGHPSGCFFYHMLRREAIIKIENVYSAIYGLTRNGWRNPAKLKRSHLQRIGYRLDEDKLIRISWPYVDRAEDDQAIEQELIDNIKELRLRFLDADDEWLDNWPPNEALASGSTAPQPKLIEVTLDMHDWGEIVRLFRVPPG